MSERRELNIYRDLVSSSSPPPPRRSARELRSWSHEARLFHEIFVAEPMTELEKEAELRREDDAERYGNGDRIMPGSTMYDDGPPDWGE